MFHTRVCILLAFIFFLHTPFLSYANKLPTPNSLVDNISVYNKYSNTDLLSQNSFCTCYWSLWNKLPKKAKRTSQQFDANNKGEMATLGNKQIDAKGESSLNKEETSTSSTWSSREEKVNRIFQHFDTNRDGGLGPEEMAALVIAVNPRVKFSDDQIKAILDEVFRVYDEYIDGEKGLTFNGLLRTYDDGSGDPDRDFAALGFEL